MVQINYLDEFKRQLKSLAKKYRSLAADYVSFLDALTSNPFQGVEIKPGIRKVRMTIASKGKGKSGGARVITYSVNQKTDEDIVVTLLTIYDKSDISNISDSYLDWLIAQIEG